MTKKIVSQVAFEIVGCAYEVHNQLGPGLLESVYQTCLVEELAMKKIKFREQVAIPVIYKGKQLDAHLRLDILVEDCVIVELKAVEILHPLFKAQLLTYLKLTNLPKGLLINFNSISLDKQNMIPLVTQVYANLPNE